MASGVCCVEVQGGCILEGMFWTNCNCINKNSFHEFVQTFYKLFFNILVAILGQEKWVKNPYILPVLEQINQHIEMQ